MFRALRAKWISYQYETPFPPGTEDPVFQCLYEYTNGKWLPCSPNEGNASEARHPPSLRIVSCNVDSNSPHPSQRLTALLASLTESSMEPEILLLQEVSHHALSALTNNPWVRLNYYLTDVDTSCWRTHSDSTSFGSITLLRKGHASFTPITVYRIPYRSHMNRDALCCDIHLHSPSRTSKLFRVINVHLDSLVINPPFRPTQLAISADYLRAAGSGIIMGDFNAITPADQSLIGELGLLDAWKVAVSNSIAHGETWGVQIEEPFPPGRLDRAALLRNSALDGENNTTVTAEGMSLVQMRVLPCQTLNLDDEALYWSDHCGILVDIHEA
ncbi:Endonuclease/exonuclease/phosphatase [Desarmillaria tabescens]|uniref:Endonuclease/exonuclease/phosphatase n=1 Tax=Armillaria tabescens TaxID=1929756 RepID=A0AA39KB11_ARMTA|nr:Endonuclease/exonuclease/phosphatase [Desarmillaria tabescens]KAK0457851.1 Endonuclease/exonuclease/phosphatase [Desarmillaria tabescens]